MSKKCFRLVAALMAFVSINTYAAFTLNGTRFVYDEGRKNISIQVTNNSDKMYGGQVWVDNLSDKENDVFFVPAPNLFKIDGGSKQLIRLLNVNDNLPKDRETVFWLNVQEIPPAPSEADSNVLAVALNTQVKLIYRPKAVAEQREAAEQRITYSGSVLKNPTPYYFALTNVFVNGQRVNISKQKEEAISLFAPFSQINLGKNLSGKVSIEGIDDYGARRVYEIR